MSSSFYFLKLGDYIYSHFYESGIISDDAWSFAYCYFRKDSAMARIKKWRDTRGPVQEHDCTTRKRKFLPLCTPLFKSFFCLQNQPDSVFIANWNLKYQKREGYLPSRLFVQYECVLASATNWLHDLFIKGCFLSKTNWFSLWFCKVWSLLSLLKIIVIIGFPSDKEEGSEYINQPSLHCQNIKKWREHLGSESWNTVIHCFAMTDIRLPRYFNMGVCEKPYQLGVTTFVGRW